MKSSYHHYNGYVIRKPVFSYDILFSQNGETLNLNEVITELIKSDFFLSAMYWSSPELYNTIILYKQGKLKEEKKQKLLHTLKKYALRSSTRSTPYGLFAGCCYKSMEQNSFENSFRKVRIDMGLLDELKTLIEKDNTVRGYLKYTRNNTAYEIADNFRFIEPLWEKNKKKYQLSSIEKSEYIQKVCDNLKTKVLTIDEIKLLISADFEDDEVEEFIWGLIDSGILISELQLGLTLADDTETVMTVLRKIKKKRINAAEKYLQILEKINRCKELINTTTPEYLPVDEMNEIRQLLAAVNITSTHIFHVDFRRQDNSGELINNMLLKNITEAVNFLWNAAPVDSSAEKQLQQFKNIFRIRYESQEIPLTQVLDNESGIGYPSENSIGNILESSILTDVKIDKQGLRKTGPNGLNEDWLLNKIKLCSKDQSVIEITDSDIKNQKTNNRDNLSHSFSVMGTFCTNQTFFLQNVSNNHALSLLGRFAYLDDGINRLCTQIITAERDANPNVAFAEILYIPEDRVGNISRRPVFTDYEIPILTTSGLPTENQILLSDIMVSIQDDEIILRSEKLNKRIIPRLSSAHNFNNTAVSAYKFLCTLQLQHTSALGINFNYENSKKRFFPRIVYKNIVLHRACWLLQKSDITKIVNARFPLDELKKYIEKWNVNRYVVLVNGDNELFLDVKNESYLNILIEELKSASFTCLAEWMHTFGSENCDNTIRQIILPLKNSESVALDNHVVTEQKMDRVRSFPPGSEWLYAKLYCSALVSDAILDEILLPLLEEWKQKDMIMSGFFIRYTDPHYHIRFRVNLKDKRLFSIILQQFTTKLEAFFKDERIWDIQLDTYKREIERYGIGEIENAEKLFYHDSLVFLSHLKNEEFAENEQIRIYAAVKNIDQYLSSFNWSLTEKFQFCKEMETAFEKEFNSELKKHIYAKYREYNSGLYEFMTGKHFDEYFDRRNLEVSKLNLSNDNLPSYIHMSINRWFASKQRAYEYMCYIFANKLYNRILNSKYV